MRETSSPTKEGMKEDKDDWGSDIPMQAMMLAYHIASSIYGGWNEKVTSSYSFKYIIKHI